MREFLTQFGLDWRLLIAQIVNFVVLLLLLKRFAYTPIIKLLNERRQKIIEGIAANEQAVTKLAETTELQKEILLKAEQQAIVIVSTAQVTAREQEELILQSAHNKGEQVIAAGQKKLEEQHLKMVDEFSNQAEQVVRLSLVKVLKKMDPTERDQYLITEALRELQAVSVQAYQT